jgi:hypothetical protein
VNLGRRDPFGVELLKRDAQQRGLSKVAGIQRGVAFSRSLRDQLDAIGDASTSHLEDFHDAARCAGLEPEDVSISGRGRLHLVAPCRKRPDRLDGVAQMGRALELLAAGGLAHLILKTANELVLAALDQQARLLDRVPVLLDAANRIDAGRDTAFDVVLQARTIALAVDDLVARSDAEQPMGQRHRPSRH